MNKIYNQLLNPLCANISTFILDTIFPKYCFGCDLEGEYLCRPCLSVIKPVVAKQCLTCRKPSLNGLTHPNCLIINSPIQTITPLDYQDPVLSHSVLWGKYKFLPDVFRVLSEYTANRLISELQNLSETHSILEDKIILCPIPLSQARLRWRGFNQSQIICNTMSKQTGWPILPLLSRTKNTSIQKDLNRKQRQQNVKDCFNITNKTPDQTAIVILVDDVITTGATMLEAIKIIRRHYPNDIICFAIAGD